MKIEDYLADKQVLEELGRRLSQLRLERNLTQGGIAAEAGVSKRTVERLEAGESVQVSNLIRLCRVLKLLDGLNRLIPETPLSPIAQLKMRGKLRRRASVPKQIDSTSTKWNWGKNS